ncbi:hypothetical protein [Roseovarius sp. D22-M7]|uniref:hypothetical protein n=1 Tax=Roseovarius sp. D22-M7 TaxID=3127116 RepID=UPI0030100A28
MTKLGQTSGMNRSGIAEMLALNGLRVPVMRAVIAGWVRAWAGALRHAESTAPGLNLPQARDTSTRMKFEQPRVLG